MKRILAVLALLAVSGFAFAASSNTTQDIDIVIGTVLAIGVNPVGTITLTNGVPAAGAQVTGDTDATTRLRYTVAASAACRVTAQLDVPAPAGTQLQLGATIGTGGSGLGNQGSSAGNQTLTDASATNIITAIPSCYTGTNAGDGALLTYTLGITGSPAAGTTSLVVTLTLQDF